MMLLGNRRGSNPLRDAKGNILSTIMIEGHLLPITYELHIYALKVRFS